MPYRRKNSPHWWVSYVTPSGQRVRCSTGTSNRKEAKALEAKWKVEAFKAKQWDEEPPRSFDEVALEYLKSRQELRSIDDVRYFIKRLRLHFASCVMNNLKANDVRSYIESRKQDGVSNATINRELEVLSAAINHANRELDWELPNPVSGRKLKEPEGRVRWITPQEAESLLNTVRRSNSTPYLADFITIALHTGMRCGEILGLEWRRVDFSQRLIHLEAKHTKSAKRRSIPINDVARASLANRMRYRAMHCSQSPWVFCNAQGHRIATVRTSFMTACRRAGISNFRIHDLRHTCAAWLVSAGVPLSEVRDLLGHSTVMVTERYAHLAPENVRAAVTQLEDIQSHFGHTKVVCEVDVPAKSLI